MPRHSNADIAKIVQQRLISGAATADVASSLAAYLLVERRTKDAKAIVQEVARLQAAAGTKEVVITSAFPLDSQLQKQLAGLFPAPKHEIVNITDPSVIGGVLVESGDEQLDWTIRRRLQRLRKIGV